MYDLSILSSVPQSLLPVLPSDLLPPLRLRPLFNVGIHDIPYLSSLSSKSPPDFEFDTSWLACTTDQVLSTKPDLYDILVTLPPAYSKNASSKVYPKIIISDPTNRNPQSKPHPIKATQRDARRYLNLRRGLRSLPSSTTIIPPSANGPSSKPSYSSETSSVSSTFSSTTILEPLSWPLLAYISFIWWASAGEKRASGVSEEEDDENQADNGLLLADLENLEAPSSAAPNLLPGMRTGDDDEEEGGKPPQEMALVAYFHRLTTLIFTTLSDAIARQDGDNDGDVNIGQEDENDYEAESVVDQQNASIAAAVANDLLHAESNAPPATAASARDEENTPLMAQEGGEGSSDDETVTIMAEDMTRMGLDVWSAADRAFVEELVGVWWGRRAEVRGGRIECCGVRIY